MLNYYQFSGKKSLNILNLKTLLIMSENTDNSFDFLLLALNYRIGKS